MSRLYSGAIALPEDKLVFSNRFSFNPTGILWLVFGIKGYQLGGRSVKANRIDGVQAQKVISLPQRTSNLPRFYELSEISGRQFPKSEKQKSDQIRRRSHSFPTPRGAARNSGPRFYCVNLS
jgi:hypothetical protein